MKRRLLSLVLAVVMTVALCPAASAAEDGWTMKELTPLGKYSSVGEFHEGMAMVVVKTGVDRRYGFIDAVGREVVPCQYLEAKDFSEGLAAVKSAAGWRYINTVGQEVIDCQCDWPGDFMDGVAVVQRWDDVTGYDGAIYGVIDKAGNTVVPFGQYEFVDIVASDRTVKAGFSKGLALVETADGLGILDKTGKEIVPCGKYNIDYDIDKSSCWEGPMCGLISVRRWVSEGTDPKYGLIDTEGREVVPCEYDGLRVVPRGFVVACLNGKYGLLDTDGQEIVPPKYDIMYEGGVYDGDDYGGLVQVGLNTGTEDAPVYIYGVIDQAGTEILPCQYTSASILNEGLVLTKLDGKYGLFDAVAREWVPIKDSYAYTCGNGPSVNNNFSNGLAMVAVDTGKKVEGGYGTAPLCNIGYIDRAGREVIPCSKYYNGRAFSEGVAAVGSGIAGVDSRSPFPYSAYNWVKCSKWGLIDTSGQEVIPCEYDDVYNCQNGFVMVMISYGEWSWDRRYGLFDKYGNQVLACEYNDIQCLSDSLICVYKDGATQLLQATWKGGRPSSTLSGTGTLGGELAWEISTGVLTVTGSLEAEDMVVVACEDAAGRFIGAAVVRAGKLSTQVPPGTAAAKLMWLGAGLAPKCPCVEAGPATS